MNYKYYYNVMPTGENYRNNLIYTSLISEDGRTFVKWYHNDTEYHQGMNEVVDSALMQAKWERELHFLHNMAHSFPDMVPKIREVNVPERKIYLEVEGTDLWQQSLDRNCSFDDILPDWREQMLDQLRAVKSKGWYKYSLHPSSYFIVEGRLKSINYFFAYSSNEREITVREHLSHISWYRRGFLKQITDQLGIDWDTPQTLQTMQLLAIECFRSNYPDDFIDSARKIFE